MDPHVFAQVAELFEAVRDLSPDEQSERLQRGDVSPLLRREVELLLAEHRSAESGEGESLLQAGAALRGEVQGDDRATRPSSAGRNPVASPTRVGRFPILGEIARGGIGVVLRAEDAVIGRDVAIKIVRPDLGRDAHLDRRLWLEGRIGGRLQHPSIVPVHELGRMEDGSPYLAMRVIEGRTLAEILFERASPHEQRQQLLDVFEKVCQAVGYAHSRGVLHRDLKPNNLMVGAFGEVQVMDWGLAKELGDASEQTGVHVVNPVGDEEGDSDLSLLGSAIGTPAYMAPEQARGEPNAADPRTDVFGLGAILCEILTGSPPFEGLGTGTALDQAMAGDIGAALGRLANSGAGDELIALAQGCIAVDPQARPRDGGEVAEKVRRYLDSLADRARQAQLDAAAATAKAAAEGRARWLTTVLGAVVVLVTLVGAWWWIQEQRDAQARERAATEALTLAVIDAERIAAAAASKAPADLSAWDGALAAARNAQRLAGPDAAPESVARVAALLANAERTRADLAVVRDLEDVALDDAFFGRPNRLAEAKAYRDRFADYLGAPLDDLGPELAAQRLEAFVFPDQLIRIFNAWGLAELQYDRGAPILRAVLATADRLDQNPLRKRLRRAGYTFNRDALLGLAADVVADGALAQGAANGIDPFTAVSLTQHLLFVNEPQRALGVLQQAQHHHPGNYEVNYHLALIYETQSMGAEYLRMATACASQRPDSAGAVNILATALIYNQRFEEAEVFARNAVALSPESHGGRLSLTRALFGQQRFADVQEQCDVLAASMIPSSPVYSSAAAYIAADRARRGDVDGALDWMCRSVTSPTANSRDPAFYTQYYSLEPILAALEARVRAPIPDALDAYLLGAVLAHVGAWPDALRALETAQRLDPSLAFATARIQEIRDVLGSAGISYGTVGEAIDALPDSLDGAAARARVLEGPVVSSPAVTAYAQGRLLEREGNVAAAIASYRQAMELDREASAPWTRFYGAWLATAGWERANAELTAAITGLGPFAVFDIVPQAPRGVASAANPAQLKLAPLRLGDPRLPHTATIWQVRRESGDFAASPVLDVMAGSELALTLPGGLLQQGVRYVWRAALLMDDRLVTDWSDDVPIPAGEGAQAVPVDLTALYTDDVVGETLAAAAAGGRFDRENGFDLVVSNLGGDSTVRGVPADRRIGVHYLGPFDGKNGLSLTVPSGLRTSPDVQIPLPPDRYQLVRALVSGANGDAIVPVSVIYEDGRGDVERWVVPDWFSNSRLTGRGERIEGTPRWLRMDRIGREGVEERNGAGLFEVLLRLDPTRRAVGIQVRRSRTRVANGATEPWLLAVTAMK